MDAAWVTTNWALVLALTVGLALLAAVAVHTLRRSARGQLRRVCRNLESERKGYRKAEALLTVTEQRKRRLEKGGDRVVPRTLREADEALADARALAKIAQDKVAIAENHVRRVIFEEFPPTEHERLRMKHLPERRVDRKPFTF